MTNMYHTNDIDGSRAISCNLDTAYTMACIARWYTTSLYNRIADAMLAVENEPCKQATIKLTREESSWLAAWLADEISHEFCNLSVRGELRMSDGLRQYVSLYQLLTD